MTFIEQLRKAERINGSLLCVGLDPEPAKFPASMKGDASRIFDFCAAIVDATADLVIAFKPQIAYFAAHGAEAQLERLMEHMRRTAPNVPIILDAKRGDIASTAEAYAKSAFENLGVDCITLSPYLGKDSIEPFLNSREKGVFLLCKTSNPGAGDVQDLTVDGRRWTVDGDSRSMVNGQWSMPLYEYVARLAQTWNVNNNIGLVVGATHIEAMKRVREAAPNLWFLAPGVGTQGGDLETALKAGLRKDGHGMLINVARSLARSENPRKAAVEFRDQIVNFQIGRAHV